MTETLVHTHNNYPFCSILCIIQIQAWWSFTLEWLESMMSTQHGKRLHHKKDRLKILLTSWIEIILMTSNRINIKWQEKYCIRIDLFFPMAFESNLRFFSCYLLRFIYEDVLIMYKDTLILRKNSYSWQGEFVRCSST